MARALGSRISVEAGKENPEETKASFFSPTEKWCFPSPSKNKPEEIEFVVDSRASMHIINRMELNPAELETVWISSSYVIQTASGEV